MIGFFIIQSFSDNKDLQGFPVSASVKSDMDDRISGTLFLPPYLRAGQCGIKSGSVVFGVMDDTTGFGAAIFGKDDADFGYFFDADIKIKKSLSVDDTITATNDIKSSAGDVKARSYSLSTHTHGYIGIPEGADGTTLTPNQSA